MVARLASGNVWAILGRETDSKPASRTKRKILADATAKARQARVDSMSPIALDSDAMSESAVTRTARRRPNRAIFAAS